MSAVARHIKKRRSELGMTQDSLAEKLFVTRQTVSNWETGRSQPDIDTLVRIAEVLKTDASALIYGPSQEPNRKDVLRGLWISGGITLLLGLAYMIGMPVARKIAGTYFIMAPVILLQGLVLPFVLFWFSWTVLQALWGLGVLKPIRKTGKLPYFITLALFLLFLVPVIVIVTEGMIDFVQMWKHLHNPTFYPEVVSKARILPEFLYQYAFGFLWGWRRIVLLLCSFLFGLAFWLTKPRNNPKESVGSDTGDNLNPKT